jgi:hypothetical protein
MRAIAAIGTAGPILSLALRHSQSLGSLVRYRRSMAPRSTFSAEQHSGSCSRRVCEHVFVWSLKSVRYEREASIMRGQLHPEGFVCELALEAAS